MKESLENIQTSISLIASEIDEIDKAVKARAVSLIGEGDVDASIKMLSKVEELARIRQEILNRLDAFEQALVFPEALNATPDAPLAKSHSAPTRKNNAGVAQAPSEPMTRKRILIHFPDGQIITGKTGAESMALAIHKIGLDRVKALGLKASGIDLISTQKSKIYNQYQFGSQYIMTNLDTRNKVSILEDISRKLGIKIRVEVI